jgi:hypothetical protein
LRTTFLAFHIPLIRREVIADYRLCAALEKLHGALMFLGLLTRVERAKIAALAGLLVFLERVEPILA